MDIDGNQKHFTLSARYTNEKNKNFGKVYHKTNLVKHLSGKYREKKSKESAGYGFVENLLSNNILLFHDCNINETISVPFWSIIKFNGKKVIHE